VSDNDSKGSTSSGKGTAVSQLGLDIADNGTFRDNVQRKNVSNGQGSLLAAVNELASVHTLGAYQQLVVSLVSVGVSELDLGNRSSTTRIVNDILDDTANVSVLFGIVECTKLHGTLAGPDMRLEDGGFSLTLGLRIKSQRNKNRGWHSRLTTKYFVVHQAA
jgi:hypothetical protein